MSRKLYVTKIGKEISYCAVKKETEIQVARGAPVFSLRPQAGLYEGVSSVPYMFSGACQSGRHSGYQKSKLVVARNEFFLHAFIIEYIIDPTANPMKKKFIASPPDIKR